jgi:hypothetical protein
MKKEIRILKKIESYLVVINAVLLAAFVGLTIGMSI